MKFSTAGTLPAVATEPDSDRSRKTAVAAAPGRRLACLAVRTVLQSGPRGPRSGAALWSSQSHRSAPGAIATFALAIAGHISALQLIDVPRYASYQHYRSWTTLFAACWAMTIWDPQTLWDMGFQLSALATASLFAYGKGTEALLLKTPLRLGWLDWAREALTAYEPSTGAPVQAG